MGSPNTSTYFDIMYPAKHMSRGQEEFLKTLVDTIDGYAATGAKTLSSGQPLPPLEDVVDFKSFARFYITEELAKDVDGYAFSVFVMVKEGRLFHAAPWDFDLAFNFACMPVYFRNAFTGKAIHTAGVEGWNVENLRDMALWIGPEGYPGGSVMKFGVNKRQLFLNMWKHPRFAATFVSAWKVARRGPLSDEALTGMIFDHSVKISTSAERDLAIWRKTNRSAFWTCCHPGDMNNFTSSTEHLLRYLLGRAKWMDLNVDKLVQ